MSSPSIADFDFERLSPRAKETLTKIAPQLEEAGRTDYAEVAAELGVSTKVVREAMEELRAELEAQKSGADLPGLTQAEYEGLRDSIVAYGQLVPIVRVNGIVIDGHHRERACLELGKQPWYVDQAREDVTPHELELIANVVRRHLTASQRRVVIEAELVHDPHRSDRSLATLFGMSHVTVGKIRRELEERGKVERLSAPKAAPVEAPEPLPPPARLHTIELNEGAVEALIDNLVDIRDALRPGAELDQKQRDMALDALLELVDALGLEHKLGDRAAALGLEPVAA